MAIFQFLIDGENISLTEVDEFICEKAGIEVDTEVFSMHYRMAVEQLKAILRHMGGETITCYHIVQAMLSWELGGIVPNDWFFELIEKYDFRVIGK